MADRTDEFQIILARAATVFGNRPFTRAQLAIECRHRNETINEALDSFVAMQKLEKIAGYPVTYRIPGGA